MHDEFKAASQVATVKVCANTARILGQALSTWQSRTRERIAVAENTKLPGWQYLVHVLLADESVASEWLIELNRLHTHLAHEDAQDSAYP